MMSFIDDRWHLDPEDRRSGRGPLIWVVAGEKRWIEGGSSIGPVYICETTPDIAERIVKDHNDGLLPPTPEESQRRDE
jgi:hypothetical protein